MTVHNADNRQDISNDLLDPARTRKFAAFSRILVLLMLGAAGSSTSVIGAEPKPLRLAIGPFFAPATDESLREVAHQIPDLLIVELSQHSQFQLVEREKVAGIWQELNLKANGLTSSQKVSDLGKILSCDWLVTGALVVSGTQTQVWTKIIDIKSSVIIQVKDLPFEANNLSAALTNIAGFVAEASSCPQAQRFVTLGRFTDLSSFGGRPDWSRRVAALIEQDCRSNGVGLVEREAIGPIFEEFQFDQANLTGSPTNRIKLQPAFLIVDGACSWVDSASVSVSLRIQRLGGTEQTLSFTNREGPELEASVLRIIRTALTRTKENLVGPMNLQEANIHTARGTRSAENNDALSPSHHFASTLSWTNSERQQQFLDNRRATLESFQKAIVLDPNNAQAKLMLGYGLLNDEDPAQRQRGKDLLREAAESKDPTVAQHAKVLLTNADKYFQPPSFHTVPPIIAAAPPRSEPNPVEPPPADPEIEKRDEFLQANFSRFVPLPFQPATNSQTVIQYLHTKENLIELKGEYYCGFQFTIPEWFDGHCSWMYLLATTETNGDRKISGPSWYIIPKTGHMTGFEFLNTRNVAQYPHLKERFPNTHDVTIQGLLKDRLAPGKTYAIWFSFETRELPDIAIAITIRSPRGEREFGKLPLD